MNDTYP